MDGQHSTQLCAPGSYNCSARTRRLAKIRNRVLALAMKDDEDWGRDEEHVVCMCDMDFVSVSLSELCDALRMLITRPGCEGVFSMSVCSHSTSCPYDIGAVRPVNAILSICASPHRPTPVRSAFGGFGLYKKQSIRSRAARYNELTTQIEHIDFNANFKSLVVDGRFMPVYEGPCMILVRYGLPARRLRACLYLTVVVIIAAVAVGVRRACR